MKNTTFYLVWDKDSYSGNFDISMYICIIKPIGLSPLLFLILS
jgi:hypothetical protein